MDGIDDRIEVSGMSLAPGAPSAVAVGQDEAEGNRRRARWMWWGFGIGLIVGFVATAIHVAISGYHILPFQFVSNLVLFPCVYSIIGLNRYRARYVGTWRWKCPQIRIGTLMGIIAYVALLFGMGVSSNRLGSTARQYYQKYVTAKSMAQVFGDQGRKSEAEVEKRRRNVEQFREGQIPDGLLPMQKDFLRSLDQDPKAAPEYRKYRRGPIRDGEQLQLTLQESNVIVFRKLADYHGKLAAKYDEARWRPWLPVEPDPPPP